MEAKDNRKRYTEQIKIIAAQKAMPVQSDINAIPRVSSKNKYRNSVLSYHKTQGKTTLNNKCYQPYYVMCKNSGIPELK